MRETGWRGGGETVPATPRPGDPATLAAGLRPLLADVGEFSRVLLPSHRLRGYQLAPVRAVAADIVAGGGGQFVWVFSRQSGKDESLAQLCAWLLTRYQRAGGTIIVAAPTLTQAGIQRDRVIDRLRRSALTVGQARTREGYIVQIDQAEARYLSAAESANPRGQTASLLLVANEAQDIDPAIWDARFDPMAASTNATTLFMGTVWDRNGLLHRQMEHLTAVEGGASLRGVASLKRKQGGEGEEENVGGHSRTPFSPQRSAPLERSDPPSPPRLVYRVPWRIVSRDVPAYGRRVEARIAQFGAQHPYIRTEYELETLDGEGGLFPPQRIAQLLGDHPRIHSAQPGKRYAGLLDVAGEEEEGSGPEAFDNTSRRDSTALTIVEVEMSRESRCRGLAGNAFLPTPRLLACSPPPLPGCRPHGLDRNQARRAARSARRSRPQRLEALSTGSGCHRRRRRPRVVPGGSVGSGPRQ